MIVKLCKTNAVYEALPQKSANFNLIGAIVRFRSAGYSIVAELPQMIIVKKNCELTIYKSGRTLLKTDSKDVAEMASKEAFGILGIE